MLAESILPALAARDRGMSADALDEILAGAQAASRALRSAIPWDAYALCAWDSMSGTHRHVTLASEGYSARILDYANDLFVTSDPAFRILVTRAPGALRWVDYTRDWYLDYSETPTAREFLIPAGFREGTTMCLRLPDGRYTGALHVSWSSRSDASDTARERIENFLPLLAIACDMYRSAQIAVERSGTEVHVMLVDSDGQLREMPGHTSGPLRIHGDLLRRLLSMDTGRIIQHRYLWIDDENRCHRIEILPCWSDITLVAERVVSWPFGLTAREVQVLDLIARGLSNPQVARRLAISPRTVSTHVEHLLDKLQCLTRAQLAAIAVRENLLLITQEPGWSRLASDPS